MDTAARHPDPARRFGLTLVATSVAVAIVAFVIFRQSPTALQPHFLSQQSGVTFNQTSQAGVTASEVSDVLYRFVGGLERNDEELMRSAFPTMTKRDLRILHGVRRRLGGPAQLGVTTLHLRSATPTDVEVDFVIESQKPDNRRVRMPFVATMHQQGDRWLISSVR